MKNILSLGLISATLTLNLNLAAGETNTETITVKPSQFNVLVFTNQTNLAHCSFIVKRLSPANPEKLPKAEREVLTTDEDVFLDMYLKTAAANFFESKTVIRNKSGGYKEGKTLHHALLNAIKFGEPFKFEGAPAKASEFVIEFVADNARGTYLVTALEGTKVTAERKIVVAEEYGEYVTTLLKLSITTDAMEEILASSKELNKILQKALRQRPPQTEIK